MIKKLILLCLIAYSIQIQNCSKTMEVCKSCKEGYSFVDFKDQYSNKCIKTEDAFLGNTSDNCLLYKNSDKTECKECKKGYMKDSNSETRCIRAAHCWDFENGECVHCERYYNLTKDGTCERINCMEFYDGECLCDLGFYSHENKECKKVPIKNCFKYDGTNCSECYKGFEKNGSECVELEKDSEHEKEEEIIFDNCWEVSEDKSVCLGCKTNYQWNDEKKECEYLCAETEVICDECDDNSRSFDEGKTCTIIDPNYKDPDSKETDGKETDIKAENKDTEKNNTDLAKENEEEANLATLINFDLVTLASLLLLII